MPFFAPCFGTIAKRLKNNNLKVIALVDNAIPHEKRVGDKNLTKYFFKYCDEFGVFNEQSNPNGSLENIAGIYNLKKKILLKS